MSEARVIAFMNQKGGVGKTTTAVNLAAGLAQLGKRTLLIDMDPQAHASLHLGWSAEEHSGHKTVYDLLTDPATPLAQCVVSARPNLALLPAEVDLAGAESELAGREDRLTRLRGALAQSRELYDTVLIDCPPSLGLLTLSSLSAAREVIIPMQAHFLALQGVGKLLQTVQLINQSVNPRLRVAGVVLCVHDSVTSHAREVVADLDQFFAQARTTPGPYQFARVYRPAVRRNIKLAECPSFGKHVFEYAPWCPGAMDYRALAEALAAETELLRQGRSPADLLSVVTTPAADAVTA
jgi:chromosome partitioning protein